jgi:hypothetical protein
MDANDLLQCALQTRQEKFEDAKGVITSRIYKKWPTKDKMANNDLQNNTNPIKYDIGITNSGIMITSSSVQHFLPFVSCLII